MLSNGYFSNRRRAKTEMTTTSDDERTTPQAEAAKVTTPFSVYANRTKLRAEPESSNSESARIMFDILAKKKISASKARDAVLKALDAAANHRLAKLRYE